MNLMPASNCIEDKAFTQLMDEVEHLGLHQVLGKLDITAWLHMEFSAPHLESESLVDRPGGKIYSRFINRKLHSFNTKNKAIFYETFCQI
jgi:hypothetical protein